MRRIVISLVLVAFTVSVTGCAMGSRRERARQQIQELQQIMNFDAIDVNDDETITRAEWDAAVAKARQMRNR